MNKLLCFAFSLIFVSCLNGKDKKTKINCIGSSDDKTEMIESAKIDTLLINDFFYAFSIDNDSIIFVEKYNELYLFEISKKQKQKIDLQIPINNEVIDLYNCFNMLFLINGDLIVDTVYFIEINTNSIVNKVYRLQISKVLPNETVLCFDDEYSLNSDLIRNGFRCFIIDKKGVDTLFVFDWNNNVIFSNEMFYSYNNKSGKVIVYDLDFNKKREFVISNFEKGNIIYFLDDFFIKIIDDILYKCDIKGNILKKWNLANSYYYKYHIDEEKFILYGWLATDTKKSKQEVFYFVKQKITF